RVSLPVRAVGARDRRCARRSPRNGQVPAVASDAPPSSRARCGRGGAMSAERLRALGDDELGSALARAIEWPETPELAANVSAAIRQTERAAAPSYPRLSLPSRRRTVLILVAAFLALAAAAVAA